MGNVVKLPVKNKRVKTDLEKLTGPGAKSIAKLEKEVSHFAKEHNKLRKRLRKKKLAKDDPAFDRAALQSMLAMTYSMIPIAEKVFRKYKNERAAYAANALVNQARELMNDLRMLSSGEASANYVVQQLLVPHLQLQVQSIISAMQDFKVSIRNGKKSKDTLVNELNGILRHHAAYVQDVVNMADTKAREYFTNK